MKTQRISKNNTAILRTLVLSLFVFGLIVVPTTEATAGFPQTEPEHRIGLKIDDSDNLSLTTEQLNEIREIGIDMLEISFPTSISTSDLDRFYLLLDSNIRYTLEYKLQTEHESIANSIHSSYNNVPIQLRDNIAAIKMFEFPADYRSSFPAITDSLLSQLSASLDKPLYYQSAFYVPEYPVQNVDFYAGRITGQTNRSLSTTSSVIYFKPTDNPVESLQMLETFLNRSLTENESLIIIPLDWFLDRINSQASFSTIISSYLNGESVNFPMPAATSESPEANWPIILFLLIWASFILHYTHQPMYKAALPRYFFHHSFFVHDVMQHRIRTGLPGIVVLLQHTVITGFFFYLLADGFMSDTGLRSLSYHYPVLFYPGYEQASLLAIGMLIALISHAISVGWLYLPNKKFKQLNQIINLYNWPFHLNLLVATIAVYIVQVQSAKNWAIVAMVFYFLIWFVSFIITAVDGARFLGKFRAPYLFLTIGLHFLLIVIIAVIALWLPGIYQPLEMAFTLP